MREIKFRAWIFGGLDLDAKPFMEKIAALVWDMDGLTIKWTRWEEISCPGEFHLMQYTGLKDKNGKEIYEGDIVDLGTGAAVEWDDSTGAWIAGDWLLSKKIIEVIGNIYENQELLGASA